MFYIRYRVMSRIKRSYENCEIYKNSQDHLQNRRKLFKGLREGHSKVMRVAKITKFTKTAKFKIIRRTTNRIIPNLFKGCQGRPGQNNENYEIYENCEIYKNSQNHSQNQQNVIKGLEGRPVQTYENCENYEIYEDCLIYKNSQDH